MVKSFPNADIINVALKKMQEKFVWTIDLLRKMETYDDKPVSLRSIVNEHFEKYWLTVDFILLDIHIFIIQNNLGFGTEEDKIIIPNPVAISEYLTKVTTDEYLVDRCFDLLYKEFQGSPVLITRLFERQGLKLPDDEIFHIELQIVESGLVDARKNKGMYHYAIKLNSKGNRLLHAYDKYSGYKKDADKGEYEDPLAEHITNVGVNYEVNQPLPLLESLPITKPAAQKQH